VLPPAPIINYTSAKTFIVNTAITPITPTGSGVDAPNYSSVPVTLATGFNTPYGVAVDTKGNVFVADFGNSQLKEILKSNGSTVVLASGISLCTSVAVDTAGNIYYTAAGANQVKKIAAIDGQTYIVGSGFNLPYYVSTDVAGNVYVADYGNNAIKMIPAKSSGTVAVTVGPAFNKPTSVAADAAGNIYVVENGTALVKEIVAYSGKVITIGSGFVNPYDIAVDNAGNVIVTDQGTQQVKVIPAGGGAMANYGAGLGNTLGVAVDGAGNIYVVDAAANAVKYLKPTGGYFINTPLPAGLNFSNVTGVISGNPAVVSPATTYVITGYNPGGLDLAIQNITTVLPPFPPIHYAGPQIYAANVTISPLTPTSSNVQAISYNKPATNAGSGLSTPVGVACDANQEVYVTNAGNGTVTRLAGPLGQQTNIGSGFVQPYAIAADNAGNVYVSDVSNKNIVKIPANGGAQTTIASGLTSPLGLAVDMQGDVYFCDGNVVKEIFARGTGTPVTIGTGFNQPMGLAVDPFFNVYVADFGNNVIKKIAAADGSVTTVATGFLNPSGVQIDGGGNLYVSDQNNNTIKMVPSGGGSPIAVGPYFNNPVALAVDYLNNVYVVDNSLTTLKQLVPTGGYYTSSLPKGLNLNPATGVLSGTPATVSPATNYFVNVYNVVYLNRDTLNIAVRPVLPATLSYSTPKIYVVGTTIATLAPTSTGVSSPGYNTQGVATGSGYVSPTDVAFDQAGNMYVADGGNNAIKMIPAGGGAAVVLGSGFSNPSGVAVDAAGNIYVSDTNHNLVKEILAAGGIATLGSGFVTPYGIAVDAAGDVFVADYGNNAVKEIKVGNPTPLTLGSGIVHPLSVALDAAGNVYVTDEGNKALKEIPVGGGAVITLASGFTFLWGVTLDPLGNIFVTDRTAAQVYSVPVGGGTQVAIGTTGYNSPTGLAVDPAGNIFTADQFGSVVEELNPVGGYYISRALPAGLSFSETTGNITGKPTVAGPPINYTVTAYNSGGPTSTQLNIQVRTVAPAAISYSSPKTYFVGTAIAPLTPTSSGVSAAAYSTTQTQIDQGIYFTSGIAFDAAGNTYVAALNDNKIWFIPAAGGAPVALASGLNEPNGIAVDAAGDVYFSEAGDNVVKELYAGTSVPVVIATGFLEPAGLALDAAGDLYVVDNGNNLVKKIPAGGGTPVSVGSNFSEPNDIAIDAAGNVYVTCQGNGALKMIQANGGATVLIAGGFNHPYGVALDNAGNMYVADAGSASILEIPAGGSTPAPIITGLPSTYAIALGPAGNIYTGGEVGAYITKVAPAGGYFIDRPLPAGLVFNSNTGAISGTPTGVSPVTNYTVNGYNAGGGTAAKVTINTIIPDVNANLSALTVSSGALSPVFATGTFSYTDMVTNSTASITFTPTAADPTATITVNGTTVKSGVASASIALAVGSNIVTTVVTAQNLTTKHTYTVNVIRPSTNSTLSGLAISNGTLAPVFNTNTTAYTVSETNGVTSITITPTATVAGSTIKVNGTAVASGSASGAIPLSLGANTINVVITAQDGVTTSTYTITATRAKSAIATLSNIALSKGTLSPVFAASTLAYTDLVSNTTTSVTLTPTVTDPNATVTVNGAAVASSAASAPITLVVGSNNVTVAVTAQDGTTKKTYTVNVIRPSTNAKLLSLTTSSGAVSPAFNNTVTSYTRAVANTVTSITITPATVDPTATIAVNGTAVTSGSASGSIALNVGANVINTVVTAQDGVTQVTYTITVNRAPSADATLSNLAISPGTIKPAFTSANTAYTVAVGNGITSVTVTPTSTDPGATMKIGAKTVTSGTASDPIALAVGANTIAVFITAQNGVTTKNYKITVTRAPSTDAKLLSLTTSSGVVSPAFNNTITSYTRAVPNATTSITFKPTVVDKTATVTVNGVATASGTSSAEQPLNVGDNVENIEVTAQDGKTTITYTVTVTRAMGSANTVYEPVSVDKPIDNPQLADDNIKVHEGVSPNGDGINDFLVIENIANYPENKLQIMNRSGQLVFEAKGYDNSTRVFDGHSNKNGAMQLPGTYFYSLDYTVNGIARHKTGFIVLKY